MNSSITNSSFIHHHCAMSREGPRAGDSKTSVSAAFVPGIFTRPEQFPLSVPRGRKQWFRYRIEMQIASQIHNEKPVAVLAAKKAQYESFRTEHGALNPIGALRTKH